MYAWSQPTLCQAMNWASPFAPVDVASSTTRMSEPSSAAVSTTVEVMSVPVQEAPRNVVRSALKVARQIGSGLYGVDMKQSGERAVVIEINDNPNIDAGVEDLVLGDELYRMVIGEFVRRLEARRLGLKAD